MSEPIKIAPSVIEVDGTLQRNPDWVIARHWGVGASEAACIMGEDPRRDPLELYAEKTGVLQPDNLADEEFVRWGIRLEPIVLHDMALPRYSGRPTRPDGWLYRSNEQAHEQCTPDGWTLVDDVWIPLEIKTTSAFKANDWEGGPPRLHWWQLQHQMLVMDAPAARIACLLGGQQLIWDHVDADPYAQSLLRERLESFWWHVLEKVPPKPEFANPESIRRALRALYPEHKPGKVVNCNDNDVLQAVNLFEAHEEPYRHAARVRNEAKAVIEAAFGDAEELHFADGTVYTYRTQHRGGYTVDPTSFRVLRRARRR